MSEELLNEINGFLDKNPQIAATTLGRLTVNDGKLVSRLQNGGQVLPKTENKILSFIDSYK